MLIATSDEGDDGVGSVIDTTKVTSSTPADQSQPQPYNGAVQRSFSQDRPPQTGQAEGQYPGEKAIPRAKNGLCSTPKPLAAVAKLFGFAIELAAHHQVKQNKNEPIID
ncbi:hypothetical protein ACV1CV_19100 [Aeromonas veronii]